ncbi:MAG: DUF2157 domain-containing protein [Ilumatobacteraceae bacterium]
MARSIDVPAYVSSLLERWVSGGVLTSEDAERIRAFEPVAVAGQPSAGPRPARRFPAVAEALGYLGGALGVAGVILLIAAYWSDWSRSVHLALTLAVTILLVAAGAVVREHVDPAFLRLRWFLWTGATPALGLFAYVVAHEFLEWDRGSQYWILIALSTTVLNGVLWAGRSRPIQEGLFCVSLAVLVGTALGDPTDARWGGVGVWLLGVVLAAVAVWRRPVLAVIPAAVGGLSVVVGSYLTVSSWQGFGFLFVAASAVVMVGAATVRVSPLPAPFDVVFGVIGILGLVQSVPGTLIYFAQDGGVATGIVVWCIGGGLIIAAGARMVRADVAYQAVGALAVLVGPAITATQSEALATIAGLIMSVVFITLGTLPGRVLLSMFGLVGLLAYVPWTIAHFFPGEGRAPLMISVSGLLIVVIAVVLSRLSGRIRRELSGSTPAQ